MYLSNFNEGFYQGLISGAHMALKRAGVTTKRKSEILQVFETAPIIMNVCHRPEEILYMQELIARFSVKESTLKKREEELKELSAIEFRERVDVRSYTYHYLTDMYIANLANTAAELIEDRDDLKNLDDDDIYVLIFDYMKSDMIYNTLFTGNSDMDTIIRSEAKRRAKIETERISRKIKGDEEKGKEITE